MATYIRPYSEIDGQIAYASAVNRYVNDFASTVNNLNSANLVASAVGATQLEQCAVTTVKLDNSSVTNGKIGDGSVDGGNLDYEVKLFHEVFS
jgi:hypothetical protein